MNSTSFISLFILQIIYIYIYIYIRNKTIYYILHRDGRGRVLFGHLEVVLKFP